MSKIVKCIYPTGEDATAGIEIDAFFSEEYNYENKLTDKPSESDENSGTGTVTEEPDTLSIEAFVGATKFEVVQDAPPKSVEDIDFPDEYPRDRIVSAFEELKRLTKTKQPLDIVTGLTVMTEMVITNFNVTRNSDNGADLSFKCTFRKKPSVSAAATPATEQASGAANTGKSGTETPPPNVFQQQAEKRLKAGQITQEEYQELGKMHGF